MSEATAPGKIILFGEHAVVYGRPAIAMPLSHLRAKAAITPTKAADIQLVAPQIQRQWALSNAPRNNPLALTVRLFMQRCGLRQLPPFTLTVNSDIPIASGMGSGAAITAAILRSLSDHFDQPHLLDKETLSEMVYEVEKVHHGTPSGIDNTVVTYERPLFFVRRLPHNLIETITVTQSLRFLIGMSGESSQTKRVVGDVRRRWQQEKPTFEKLFDACGRIALAARTAVEKGEVHNLGQLMDENHHYLDLMTVSSSKLNALTKAANDAGALGAKLSGAGRGGNMITLVQPETEQAVRQALLDTGAAAVYATTLQREVIFP